MISSRLRTLRLIPYAQYDAVTNMAIDETLLELHLAGKTPATLRFYGWKPPAVSFGYSQKVSERTVKNVQAAGYEAVRRPTGGRAVLHEGELTYCFVGSSPQQEGLDFRPPQEVQEQLGLDQGSPYEGFLAASVNEAYKQICRALIAGFTEMGVSTDLGKSDSAYKDFQDCFQATTQADLHYQGKKLVGSAQLRRRHGVLQHGSIIIDQSQTKLAEILGLKQGRDATPDSEAEFNDESRHCNLSEVVPLAFDRTRLEEAIGRGFTRTFDCRFAVYDLTDDEMEIVKETMGDGSRYRFQFPKE
jgi:lipoate-protein ligase A